MLDFAETPQRAAQGSRRCFRDFAIHCIVAILLAKNLVLAADAPLAVKVPEGFQATLYANDDLAHDIYSMTIDSLGRVVVSGPGYVRILIDADLDGVAESYKDYIEDLPQGAQGMFFLGRDLICAAGEGLVRYRDRNQDDRADGPADVFLKIKTGNEHDLHAIRKGADGWWYVVAGNTSEINEHYASLPTSPVKKPHAGVILRLKPDLTQGEIYAHGMRNAYDFDFTASGDLFTFDSDGEKVLSLPWYRPTRVLHLLAGAHAGWVTNDWIRPDYFFDMPPVTASMGRGSPTGVVSYRHTAFPSKYHGALFVLDWTYGKVHALPLEKNGSTWSTEPIEFMSAIGQQGFAPTDVEVGPQGELYVCVGGRGTRGAIYCIRPTQKNPESRPWPGGAGIPATVSEKLDVCLRAPQPLSSWARRVWEPLAADLTSEPFIKASQDESRPAAERVRAIEILTEKFHGIDRDLAAQLHLAKDPSIRARAAWALGRTQPRTPNTQALSPYLSDPDPHVVRNAMEVLIGSDNTAIEELITPLGQQLAHRDRFVRQTAMRVLSRTSGTNTHKMAQIGFPRGWSAAIPVSGAYALASEGFASYSVDIGLSILQGKYEDPLKLEAVRILQLGLGDLTPAAGKLPPVYDGYAPRMDLSSFETQVSKVRTALDSLYPTGIRDVDWELERVIAMVQPTSSELLSKVIDKISPESDPVEDIHRLIVASRIPVKLTLIQRVNIVEALIRLESKMTAGKFRQDSDWDERILEMYDSLLANDPELPIAVASHPDFGMPGHVQLISKLPRGYFPAAVASFMRKIASTPDYAWNSDVIFLLAASSQPAAMELIRSKFSEYSLRSAVLTVLTSEPDERDRPLFLEALESSPVDSMLMCIAALQLLQPSADPMENVVLAKTLRKLGDEGEERQARDQLVEVLRMNLKQDHGYILGRDGDPQRAAITAWINAVQAQFPKEFAAATASDEGSLPELHERLSKISWQSGNAEHGLQVFNTRGCAQCHGQRRALGPALEGVAGRFSREDLFTAIAFPSRDISPRYQATQVATTEGHVLTGLVLYETVDVLALRDANNQTYRIDIQEIEERRTLTQSLMPAGLLKGLTDQDLADLYAYLQSLGTTSTASAPQNGRVD
ncbi:PVC-type heme-binding CxxCH protein [Planctomicrobium sp. SH661]|uniref:PVC-type heme-binding CxxCH protein n=1 Tax=Planctomicrobium sp. SH661 TaxID=3448124 RepID=UPI003F5AED40